MKYGLTSDGDEKIKVVRANTGTPPAKTLIKPMLAEAIDDIQKLKFPLIASPKLDGIRCLKINGRCVTRSLKPIPNDHINKTLSELLPDGIDGEIMSGDTFQECTSAVMRVSGKPVFHFVAFDLVTDGNIHQPYSERLAALDKALAAVGRLDIAQPVVSIVVSTLEELLAFETKVLARGFEGVMVRKPEGPYKCGRSTVREGWLLKLKRFVDAEAEIVSVEEMMENTNEKRTNELGQSQRSTAKAGKKPRGVLGAFVVRDLKSGLEFNVGTGDGLTLALRAELWGRRDTLPGLIIKYKSQPTGVKEAPRFPIFLGFRDARDMSKDEEG